MSNNSLGTIPQPINEPVCQFLPQSQAKADLKSELKRQQQLTVEIPIVIGENKIFDRNQKALICPHQKKTQLASVAAVNQEDCTKAISSALSARSYWATMAWEDRASVFLKAADLLTTKYRDKINAATMLGQSKTCHQAEIDAVCELADFFRFNAFYANQLYREQPLHSPKGQWNRSESRGLEGFVFAVGPFNFTSIAVNLATTPALMGCCVVWKPAHTSLLASYYMLEILTEAGLPPGVINLISGDHQLISNTILHHPELAGIHFTGSTKTFDYLWSEVGKNISSYNHYPRLVGETGGKDFIVAHNSADPDQLLTALIRGSFEYQGQKCSASSRAYIPKSLWSKLRDNLIDTTNSIKMGNPMDFTNFMSAVIDQSAFNKISRYIENAKNDPKARILCGGEYNDEEGFFIRPTIIEALDPTYQTMVEEIFGPVLTVFIYDDHKFEETLDLVDRSTPYALTGAIFATDRRVINQMSDRLSYAAGNFYINDKPTGAVVGQQPFGGARRSGTNDKAGSIFNLLRWSSHRTIKENFLSYTSYQYPFMGEV